MLRVHHHEHDRNLQVTADAQTQILAAQQEKRDHLLGAKASLTSLETAQVSKKEVCRHHLPKLFVQALLIGTSPQHHALLHLASPRRQIK